MKICIVTANYYPKISKNLLLGCLNKLKKHRIKKTKLIYAPGVFEIPVIISKNIKSYDAFVALACVIKGETPHFQFISSSSINALV